MANVYNTVYKKGNVRVPIKVHLEKRMDYRFSIAKRSAILRMPSWFLKKQRTKTYDKFIAWLENHHNNTPDMFTRFEIKQYQDGDDIILFGETYTLDISVSDTNRVQAKVIEDGLTIYIMIPVDLGDDRDLHVTSILKKIVPKALKPKVEAMPEYKRAENWISAHGNKYYF